MTLLAAAFVQALLITGFVLTMMVLIEYINVRTQGWWQEGLGRSRWKQHAIAVTLGAIPGCLGAFTVVSLYAHGAVSFGALVGTMIATSGDEAFVMLAMFPRQALLLTVGLMALGWVAAVGVDRLLPRIVAAAPKDHRLPLHPVEECRCFEAAAIPGQLRNITFSRALLMGFFLLLLLGLISGSVGPVEWNWVRISLLGSSLFALFVATTVPDHFLREHLWEHILKGHLPKIFAWTFGALLVIGVLSLFFEPASWIRGSPYAVLLVASLVGLIPESGPHMIFVTLYAQGILPFGILAASSIVQDGHGTLPLLAVSRRAFVALKVINFGVGFTTGGLILLATS